MNRKKKKDGKQEKQDPTFTTNLDKGLSIKKTQKQLEKEHNSILNYWLRTEVPTIDFIPDLINIIHTLLKHTAKGEWTLHEIWSSTGLEEGKSKLSYGMHFDMYGF